MSHHTHFPLSLIKHTHTQRRETHRRQESDVTVVIETARTGCDWLRTVDGGRPCLRCTLAVSSLFHSLNTSLFVSLSLLCSFNHSATVMNLIEKPILFHTPTFQHNHSCKSLSHTHSPKLSVSSEQTHTE